MVGGGESRRAVWWWLGRGPEGCRARVHLAGNALPPEAALLCQAARRVLFTLRIALG